MWIMVSLAHILKINDTIIEVRTISFIATGVGNYNFSSSWVEQWILLLVCWMRASITDAVHNDFSNWCSKNGFLTGELNNGVTIWSCAYVLWFHLLVFWTVTFPAHMLNQGFNIWCTEHWCLPPAHRMKNSLIHRCNVTVMTSSAGVLCTMTSSAGAASNNFICWCCALHLLVLTVITSSSGVVSKEFICWCWQQ